MFHTVWQGMKNLPTTAKKLHIRLQIIRVQKKNNKTKKTRYHMRSNHNIARWKCWFFFWQDTWNLSTQVAYVCRIKHCLWFISCLLLNFAIDWYSVLYIFRSASNSMDKGACYSANSKIQIWRPNTNYSTCILNYSLIRILVWMLEYVMVDEWYP